MAILEGVPQPYLGTLRGLPNHGKLILLMVQKSGDYRTSYLVDMEHI